RPGNINRPRIDRPDVPPAGHAAHVAHQRDLGDRGRRIHRGHGCRVPEDHPDSRGHRAVRLHDQHRQWIPHHRPHAEDVQEAMTYAVDQLAAILATALLIFSLYWMNDPKTARHAVGAGVAGMLVAGPATRVQPAI